MTSQHKSEPLFPVNFCPSADQLPPGFLEFLAPLHTMFTPWQQKLVDDRAVVLARCADGILPGLRDDPTSEAIRDEHSPWKCTVPDWCADQRNQMTGPADDGDMVVKMLNSGAPGVMIDLEDSEANTWECLSRGVTNAVSALHGELSYFDQKRGAQVAIRPSKTVVFVRVRGLHMSQQLGFETDGIKGPVAASLFDAALLVHQLDPAKLKHPLCIYIPKSESADEAALWSQLFKALALAKGLPTDFIKCMALVEAHPMAYQMEEFLFHLRDHIVGLNLGRWDYMASLIHFTMHDPNWVLPDRNTIPSDVAFFQKLRVHMVDVCHRRGALAIGGMTALFPSRTDAALNERALEVLARDKKNEADCGMDGAWTGHPDQNAIAVAQFPVPNQLGYLPPGAERTPDLRPLPTGIGKITLEGTRNAIRTCILYRAGVLNGKGASLLGGYMEDLATDRIYRNMIAQRVLHSVVALDDGGGKVAHNRGLVEQMFRQELGRIIATLEFGLDDVNASRYAKAAEITQKMIFSGTCDPT